MSEFILPLTDEQRQYLSERLEEELKRVRVEYRRTATAPYREVVKHEEDIIFELLEKLKTGIHSVS